MWVSLVGAPNVTPFAAKAAATAARNAALGLAGVAGCALCRVLCFASAAERTNNETGLEHLRLLAATKTALKDIGGGEHRSHGVTAVLEDARGAATEALEAALGAVVTGVLVLRNGGPSFWTLTAPQLQPPLPGHLFKPATAAQTLEPNETARIPLRYAPTQAGVATVIVSVALARDGDAEWHTRARVGVMVTLRCVDPEAAARLAALAPASPFKRPRRFRDAWPSEVEDAPPAQISPGAKNGAKFWSPSKVPLALVQGHNVPGSAAFDALDAQLAAAVTHAEHAQRFKLLLLCEEAAASSDMAAYDIHAAALTPAAGGRWRVEVPGLAEGRPSVARHDTVVLRRPGDRARAYRGRVDEVRQTSLGLLLGQGFAAAVAGGGLWDVRFELRRAPFLLQHAAVAGVGDDPACVAAVVAPRAAEPDGGAAAAAVVEGALPAPLHMAHLNERQQAAVRGALYRLPFLDAPQPPLIIFGPPGTGKTTTVAEYVMQVVAAARARGARPGVPAAAASLVAGMAALGLGGSPSPPDTLILVAAPSNAAVDVLAERLLAAGLPPAHLLRVNAFQRTPKTLPAALVPCAAPLWSASEDGYALPTLAQLRAGAWVVAATCSTAQKLIRCLRLAAPQFSHVIVDEAGQATEPECLCAVAGAMRAPVDGGARVVLAGDPFQLGPVLRSALAIKHGLGVSLLERLMQSGPHAAAVDIHGSADSFNPAFVEMLTHNYRSHAQLLAVPNARFYGGALEARADEDESSRLAGWPGLTPAARAVPGGFPLLVHGVQGEDMREGNSPSFLNSLEAVATVAHIESVLAYAPWLRPEDVGVVTPYRKQCDKIKTLIGRNATLRGVMVGSVEIFQGGEKRVIVVSTVRSSREHLLFDAQHALGFLRNPKRFNIAVTRARQLLVIVGNPAILALDDAWGALLRFAVAHGAYAGCALPPAVGDADMDASGGGGGPGGLVQVLAAGLEADGIRAEEMGAVVDDE